MKRLDYWLALGALLTACSGSTTGTTTHVCGNGVVEEPEQCDLGLYNDDAGGCRLDCTRQSCGDGVKGPDEACDDGNAIEGDGCEPDCTKTNFCGNALPNPGEACDDGNLIQTDGCLVGCIAARCGDEILRTDLLDPMMPGYEQCDEGNRNSDFIADACRQDCRLPWCGDGVIDTGETCDDGPTNDDTTADACRTDCELAGCGDGVTDMGEDCDDGVFNSDTVANACRLDCTDPGCGDAVDDDGEDCDDGGDSSACDADCTTVACGDGYTNPAADEDCDDAGETSTCDSDCTVAECGDGHVNAAANEECDTADVIPNGVCSVGCQVGCTGFWENCDGLPSNGCERYLLDDPDHCGACGHDCGGGTCVDGVCQPLQIADLGDLPAGSDLLLHAGVLYATTDAGIVSVPASVESLTTPTSVSSCTPYFKTLLVVGADLYFASFTHPDTGEAGLHRVPLAGGMAVSVHAAFMASVGADATHLYFVQGSTLRRKPLAGGMAEDVGALPSSSIPGIDILVEPAVVYAPDMAGGIFWRLNKDPMNFQAVPVVDPDDAVFSVAADATHLYWANLGAQSVQRIDKDPFGCLPAPICTLEDFAAPTGRPIAVHVDATHVYWASGEDALAMPVELANLARKPLMGGGEEPLFELGFDPRVLEGDADFLYWTEQNGTGAGGLWKLRKPLP